MSEQPVVRDDADAEHPSPPLEPSPEPHDGARDASEADDPYEPV
ncbi:hypothetical protein ACQPZJ_14785 [Actinoplanes sp. CA-054009]